MKRIFIVTCLLTFVFVLSAQGGQGGQGQRQGRGFQMSPERLAQYYDNLKTELKLTDKQVADIKKIDEGYRTKQQELFEKYRDDRDKMREEWAKLRTEQNAKIKPLLSAEQFKKYEELQVQRMQRGQGGGGNRQN